VTIAESPNAKTTGTSKRSNVKNKPNRIMPIQSVIDTPCHEKNESKM